MGKKKYTLPSFLDFFFSPPFEIVDERLISLFSFYEIHFSISSFLLNILMEEFLLIKALSFYSRSNVKIRG